LRKDARGDAWSHEHAGSAMNKAEQIQARFFPETQVAGFSHVDGSVDFWSRVRALVTPESRVLDYGAGRGAFIDNDSSRYRRQLKIVRGHAAHVTGCDVDPAVKENPFLDAADVIDFSARLPYPDASFDLIYSNWVFEHVVDPAHVASELLRVLKPGGWICAATANKWGYVALVSAAVPNRSHAKVLSRVSPEVKDFDVFPTMYRMNTPGTLRRLFTGARVVTYRRSSEPSYHFNNPLLYRGFMVLHDLMPSALQTGLFMFAQKAGSGAAVAGLGGKDAA
jgi:SAM-dependent methyltransferase